MEKTLRPRFALKTTAKSGELRRDLYARARQAKAEGKKVAWIMGGVVPAELFAALDVVAVGPEQHATFLGARQEITPYLERAEDEGFHRDICSYARCNLGYAAHMAESGGSIPYGAAEGGIPAPDILVGTSRDCEPHTKWFQSLARYIDVPCHVFDFLMPPRGANWRDPEVLEQYVRFNVAGLRSLIAFLEQQVGRKMDENRLTAILDEAQQSFRLWDAVHELRKAVPSPMPTQDYFSTLMPFLWMPGLKETTRFYQELHDEVLARVLAKTSVTPREQFRLMWVGFPQWFNMGLLNYAEKYGGVFAIEEKYHWRKHIEVDTSDPVVALAQRFYWWFEGDILRHGRIELVRDYVKEFNIDGVVMQNAKSCRQNSQGNLMAREILSKSVHLPTMLFDGDMADPREFSFGDFEAKFDPFMELVASSRKSRMSRFT